ncbi:tRNA(Ile)-lysidine synthase [Tessaracoccus flavus]|nr:tRNA(Ile)-lysidine synthase [Tessaracoccus flavus]
MVGCSGGADSLALALGAAWAAARTGADVAAVVVDHGLRPDSGHVSSRVVEQLRGRGLDARVVRVQVEPDHPDGLEAAARHARLATLEATGRPVLLGHTLDDQAETVLLGLLRGSGTRSLAGMAAVRGPFIRPLLGLRRADTEAACGEWGIEPWQDPMNDDERYARVRTRRLLPLLTDELGRDVAPALARTARLARADADHLDALALAAVPQRQWLEVADLEPLPDALLWRVVRRWLAARSPSSGMEHVLAVARLVGHWHGQGPVAVPGAVVRRVGGRLLVEPSGAARQDDGDPSS